MPSVKLASSLLTRNTHSYTDVPEVFAAPTGAISTGGQRQLDVRYNEDATPGVKRLCCWLRNDHTGLSMKTLQEAK